MELNFTCINSEIYNIVNNRKKYDNYIILVCLAIRELITIIKKNLLVINL
jgi:hypothetical protein